MSTLITCSTETLAWKYKPCFTPYAKDILNYIQNGIKDNSSCTHSSHVVGVASERRTATRSRDTNRNIKFLHTQRILPDNDDKSAGIMQQNLEASERKMELKPPSVNDASGKEATTTSTTEVIVAKDESIQEVSSYSWGWGCGKRGEEKKKKEGGKKTCHL